jgi:hypothetical protein
MRVPIRSSFVNRIRRDGWTVERQIGFLAALARIRCVTRAAATVGMSRESAYRLRMRPGGALFAAQWDRALRVRVRHSSKGYNSERSSQPVVTLEAAILAGIRRRQK